MLEGARGEPDHEAVLVLVKALPHVGDKHGETVCCAGVAADGKWRRLFPVSFRSLEDDRQFGRWDWIEYQWRRPTRDRRTESRHVQENSIRIVGALPRNERGRFLNPIVRNSVSEAEAAGETLTLIRPHETRFYWEPKDAKTVRQQSTEYEAAANQLSLFARDRRPLMPCPFDFRFSYRSADGRRHTSTCDDWETAATYFRLEKRYGRDMALARMDEIFNKLYPAAGMVFAMGTHSRYPQTWLLVGVVRLDADSQAAFTF